MGVLYLTSTWFYGDDFEPSQQFFLYADNENKLVYNANVRSAWKKAIKPLYVDSDEHQLFLITDVKSNPRRVHPFCKAFTTFLFEDVLHYLQGKTPHLPVLVTKPMFARFKSQWRQQDPLEISSVKDLQTALFTPHKVTQLVTALQRWYRRHSNSVIRRSSQSFRNSSSV